MNGRTPSVNGKTSSLGGRASSLGGRASSLGGRTPTPSHGGGQARYSVASERLDSIASEDSDSYELEGK